MAYSNIDYYQVNILRGLPNWNILNNANIVDDYITINPGGYAGCTVSNTYFSGLSASLYRRLNLSINVDTSLLSNYQNNVEVILEGIYISNQNEYINLKSSVNVSLIGSRITDNSVNIERVLPMLNYNLLTLTVYIANNTSQPIIINSCQMLRSQDVSSGQISGAIGYAVKLIDVDDRPNGVALYYEGISEPDKFFWILNSAGKFAGININNSHRMNYSYSDEILTM